MSDVEICDKCGRRTIEGSSVSLKVSGDVSSPSTAYDKDDTYDLHQSCWNKIKATFKKRCEYARKSKN